MQININDESMAMLIEMADDGGEEEGQRPTTDTFVGDNTTLSFVHNILFIYQDLLHTCTLALLLKLSLEQEHL